MNSKTLRTVVRSILRGSAFGILTLSASQMAWAPSSAVAAEVAIKQIEFNIAPQSVKTALFEFSRQADVQVMIGDTSLIGQMSKGVKGRLDVASALERLLQDTGLRADTDGHTVMVRPAAKSVSDTVMRPLSPETTIAAVPATGTVQQVTGTVTPKKTATASETLDEVVVTGSHIRGETLGGGVISISSQDIERTGLTSAQDWIQSLPQNFGSTPNEENGGIGNFNRGTGVNLRGLGAGATLILIDGQRQPASGTNGDFVDVSSIPMSAVDRVEILTDGASAIYGSDAIGGVVNFVLKKTFEGIETKLRYSAADGGADERVADLVMGQTWSSGHILFDYQYSDRNPLDYGDRDFTASADKRPFGGTDFRNRTTNPGNIIVGSTIYPIPTGQDGTALTPSSFVAGPARLVNQFEDAWLLPSRTMHSIFAVGSQNVSDRLELFGQARFSRREFETHSLSAVSNLTVPTTNAFYVAPTGISGPLTVAYDFIDDFGTTNSSGESKTLQGIIGLSTTFGASWRSSLTGSYGREQLDYRSDLLNFTALFAALASPNRATAFNPFGDGSHTNPATLQSILTAQIEHSVSDLRGATLQADGQLFALPGGSVKLALGADYRRETLEKGAVTRTEYERSVDAAFAELSVPIVGETNEVRGIRTLDLSAAGRYERYSDFGNTFNPKFGIRYSPLKGMNVRGTWGTSFRAPNLVDLDVLGPGNNASSFPVLPDPTKPSGVANALLKNGGNPDLTEETADTWTLGVDFSLPDDLDIALTYYQIKYKDRIVTPGPASPIDVLRQEGQWGTIIERNPSTASIAAVCNGRFTGNVATCLATRFDVIVDFRKRNISATETTGFDLLVDKSWRTRLGTFGLGLNGTYVPSFEVATTSTSPSLDVVDTLNNPVSTRLRTTASWTNLGFGVSVAMNRTGSYETNVVSPSDGVDSWTTFDVRLSYQTQNESGLLAGIEAALTASNVLDEDPPFINRAVSYDTANTSPLGRFIGFQVKKAW